MKQGALLVAGSDKTIEALGGLLRGFAPGGVEAVRTGAQARRRMLAGGEGLVVINTPLADEFGDALAQDWMARGGVSVVLIVKSERAEEVAHRVERDGVLVLSAPISKALFSQTVRLAAVTQQKLAALQRENHKLQKRLEEQKLVGRAKCALIQYRDMTEPEAHRYIEREAMDSRITRMQVAQEILRTFEG